MTAMKAHLGRRTWVIGCALASAFSLASCTSDGDPGSAHPSSSASATARSSPSAEKKLTAEVQSALAASATKQNAMVESGVERVTDGVHSEPLLDKGNAYRLSVVCAGSGDVEIAFTPTSVSSKKDVSCDQSTFQQRFTGVDSLRIDVTARRGSTGMIGWRIDRV
ncbi:hypothetical protein AB0N14_21580 [Streptomyces sp. NPDC051104]|uniref:hypothetical protein n=1 Tax=Streptomyces sp. NPDC051104 TaxID=3155044 RepID=UPI00343140E5